MEKNLKAFKAGYRIEAVSLKETLSVLTEIHQRTGIGPEVIHIPGAILLTWNPTLAIKTATGKLPEEAYINACRITK